MSADTIAAVVGSGAAAIGLIYTAYQIRSDNKTRQLDILETVYRDIKSLEERFYDKYLDATEEERETWDYQFFNQLEWFSFLVNHKKIRDQELIGYFKSSIIQWYEQIFLPNFGVQVIADPTQFEEFKKLYQKFKSESTKSQKAFEPTIQQKLALSQYIDPKLDPESYLTRYNNEADFKNWFDNNFPNLTIYTAFRIKKPSQKSK